MNDQPADKTKGDRPAGETGKNPCASGAADASGPTVDRNVDPEAVHRINQRLFDTSLDLILVVDRRGTFKRVSPSAAAILGYQAAEMIGRSAAEFIHPDDLESTRAEMRLARRGRSMRNFDCRYVHRNGAIVLLTWTGVWAEPEQQHFFIGRDMTERARLEQQLRHAQKMDAIGQLTGGIAHDFNNILLVIIGMTELLRDAVAGNSELAAIVTTIDEAAERGVHLTQRMLAFARKQPLQARILDLNDIVDRMSEMLRRTLGEHIAVQTRLTQELWPAFVDPSQFEDAILNLAVNARDAMPGGGRLVLETSNEHLDDDYAAQNMDATPGDYVAVMVTDSGIGMPADVAERAFEPFFTTKEVGSGTGLGLSMVYGFVRQSRGHVKIYSEPGHGTSVKLYLPRADAADKITRPSDAAAADSYVGGRETILVVEDDNAVRAVAVGVLQGLGYEVLQAEDGKAALAILDTGCKVDLLFTDMIMPNGISGPDLLQRAREQRPDLKVLFTSGYSEHFVENRTGIDRSVPLLSKPYRRQKLAAAVRSALDAQPGPPRND